MELESNDGIAANGWLLADYLIQIYVVVNSAKLGNIGGDWLNGFIYLILLFESDTLIVWQ